MRLKPVSVLACFVFVFSGYELIASSVKHTGDLYAIYSDQKAGKLSGISIAEDYGAFVTAELTENERLSLIRSGFLVEPLYRHQLRLGSGHRFESRSGEPLIPESLSARRGDPGYYIVQFYSLTRSEWIQEMQKLGAVIVQSAYFPNFGYLVWVPNQRVLQNLNQLSFVNWIGLFHPVYKTIAGADGAPELLADTDPLRLRIKTLNEQFAESLSQRLSSRGFTVTGIYERQHQLVEPYIVVETTSEKLISLLQEPEVWWVEKIRPMQLTSRVARELHQTGVANGCAGTLSEVPIWNTGITGAGTAPLCSSTLGTEQLVGVLDTTFNSPDFGCGVGGPDIPNCTIFKFVEYNTASGCTTAATRTDCISGHSHGSGSAGVILGSASQQGGESPIEACRDKGGAFGARLWGVKCDQGAGDLHCLNTCHSDGGVTTIRNVFQASFADGSRMSNHSWGCCNNGVYDANSEVVDVWSYDNDNNPANGAMQDYLWLFAAGNSGSGANTIGSPATAKNDATGAAVYNGVDGACFTGDSPPCNENKLVIYSGRGPTDDGRYGPEVAGASQFVTAPDNGAGYQEFNGTSCGTPSVTALAALIRNWLQQVHGIASPSGNLVKALLLNSGDYITTPVENLPGRGQGWGRPNLSNLCDNWATGTCTNVRSQWREGTFTSTGQSDVSNFNVSCNPRPVRCLLTWMDPPNLGGGGALRNNLNLRLTNPTGTFYLGNDFTLGSSDANGATFDSANNSEGVRVPSPAAGTWTLEVLAGNITSGPQPWAVACSGELVSPGPLLDYQSSTATDDCTGGGTGDGNSVVEPGENVILQVTAGNVGSSTATGIVGTLTTVTPGITITDDSATFPNIGACGSASSNASHFAFTVGTGVTCPSVINFTIQFTSNEGTWSDTFTLNVGSNTPSAPVTFNSTDVPKAIPDNPTITSILNIADTRTINDINLTLNITHTWDGDLDMFLISPGATSMDLATDVGGSGDNFTNTTFDDEAATPITSGTPPFSGTFRPEGLLSTFDGTVANGTWTLSIDDDVNSDTGTLNSWSMTVVFNNPVCNVCTPAAGTPKEASPSGNMTAAKGAGTSVNVTYTAASCATDHAIFRGTSPISGSVSWTNAHCALGTSGSANFDPGTPAAGTFFYWVIVGQTATEEGSYGRNSSNVERPEAVGVGACNRPQDLVGSCP